MKKYILPILAVVLLSFTNADSKLTQAERTKAVEHLTKTHDHLLKAVEGLSKEQLNYKPSNNVWSVAECVEHITISENSLFNLMQGLLKSKDKAATTKPEKTTPDDEVIAMMVDRSNKVKTSEPFEPSGRFGSYEETLTAFKKKRASNIEFIKNTEADLRGRFQQMPFGTLDAYQLMLFLSAHAERHVLQIEELLADDEFPD
ncbi:DinB family protein [Spongiivirga sp. MCCC 1A20706]|uniref:DinB family protein n=1 Tax=Spongiivirga sp. MCCC 1A20706 TaxID=3160963 RepID=UPI003977A60B